MLSFPNLALWNKTNIEKRKLKISFSNFQAKIENWKLKKKCLFSIFDFKSKLKYTKMAFFITILNENCMALSVHVSVARVYFNFFNCIFSMKIDFYLNFQFNFMSNYLIRFWILKYKSIKEFQFSKWKLKIRFSIFNFQFLEAEIFFIKLSFQQKIWN